MATKWNDAAHNVGDVTSREFTQLVFDVNIVADVDANNYDEILIRVNGKVLTRMHPFRAERLGIVRR
jgi:hypothetical protein